ncbi:hypothetical protein TWF173_001403 [Orbilia oligospora]|nr:hypothetical protein TWF173_001403 [Orbilia oligospora]
MPWNSRLRKVLSKVASGRDIRRELEGCVTVTYVKNSRLFIMKVPFSNSTTIYDLKEMIAAHMALDSAEDLGVIILPYGCKQNDPRLKDLAKCEWEKAKELILSIQPKSTIRRDSRIGYPRAACLSGSNFTLRQLLYPWDPMDVEFFVGAENSPLAVPNERSNLVTMYHQLESLSSASVIRGRGGGRDSYEQKAFRAAIISHYGLDHPNNPNVPDADKRYRCQLTGIYFPSERLKASHICPASENGIASLIGLRSPMDVGNGLLLHASVEKLFDAFRITITPSKNDIGKEIFILRVFSSRLLNARIYPAQQSARRCEGEEVPPLIRWRDLDRRQVKFSTQSDITPLKRALHWHAQNARYHLHRSKYGQEIDLSFSTFASDEAREFAHLISSGLSSFGSPSQIKNRRSWASAEISIKSEIPLPPALYVSPPLGSNEATASERADENAARLAPPPM